ncbi:MAG: peptide-binding protein [bacterium]
MVRRLLRLGIVLLAFTLFSCGAEPDPPSNSPRPAGGETELRQPASPSDESPVIGDTLVRHLRSEPSTLNPILSTDAYASEISSYIGESLVRRNPQTLELEPELAESWEISPDHLTYVFHLRRDVRWHDGAPFTARDVKFSFQKIVDPTVDAAHLRNYYQDVARLDLVDAHTVRFVYRRPYFKALEICGGLPLVAEHVYEEGDFNHHPASRTPLGTGPYLFHSWKTGKEIVLERNPRYWGKPVYMRRIVFRLVTDDAVALQVLKKNEIDWMGLTPLQWEKQTVTERFHESFAKIRFYEPYYNYIGWNAKSAYFADRRVRTAMTLLIGRRRILERLLFGMGVEVTGTFYVNSPEYDRSILPLPHDSERARRLLGEAGWEDHDGDGVLDSNGVPFRFEFLISAGSTFAEQLATVLKEDLIQVGIVMQIRKLEWAVFIQQIEDRRFDAVTLGWSLSAETDPYQLWHSSQAEKGSNFVGFVHEEADRIMEEARVTFDRSKRILLYRRLQRILYEEQPYTFLFCSESLVALDRRFHNVRVYPLGLYPREWFVPAALRRYP